MLTVERISDFNEFLKLEPVWNKLLAQSDSDHPFLTFEWLTCWWNNYGRGNLLLILLVKEGQEVLGIAPLMQSKMVIKAIPLRVITFIANFHSNRAGFILIRKKKEVIESVVDYLRMKRINSTLSYFDFIEKDSDTDRILGEVLKEKKLLFTRKFSFSSPYIPITETWEQYLKGRSSNLRHKLKRTNNAFAKEGDWNFKKFEKDDINLALEHVLAVSSNTWKFKEETAIASKKENVGFYTSLAHSAAKRGWLNIWILLIKTKPIAFIFNLNYSNKIFSLKIGFDETYSKFSPSEFINTLAIKESFDNREVEYDWLGENLPFKMKWTSTCREHEKYHIFSEGVYGKFLYFVETFFLARFKRFKRLNPSGGHTKL